LFNSNYCADVSTYRNNELVTSAEDIKTSILTDEFFDILVIMVNFGYEFAITREIILKPYVSLGISSSIYDTGELDIVNNQFVRIYYSEEGSPDFMFAPIFTYGISTEYRFSNRNSFRKKK